MTKTLPFSAPTLATNIEEVRSSIHEFNLRAKDNRERALDLLRRTTFWLFDPRDGSFGPSKFVAFGGMTFEAYDEAASQQGRNTSHPLGGKFSGDITRTHAEALFRMQFASNPQLSEKLIHWGEGLLGPGAFGNRSSERWRFLILDDTRRYWAFLANPNSYRIEEAVSQLDEDLWIVPSQDVRKGDRIIIWKAKGRDKSRGVVALAEALTDPAELPSAPELGNYWVETGQSTVRRRVRVRYVRCKNAPLWEGEPGSEILKDLSVSRATGGSIFKVEPEQWAEVVAALGGWPIPQIVNQNATPPSGNPFKEVAQHRNPPWERQELILALELYMKHRAKVPSESHPDVQSLSRLLRDLKVFGALDRPDPERFRNPNGVAMKLSNFLRLDPTYHGKGLDAGSRRDEEIWLEFANDPTKLTQAAEAIRETVRAGRTAAELDDEVVVQLAKRPQRKVRAQGFAKPEERKAVELHAMELAHGHFSALGYTVTDVSANSSYDLKAERSNETLFIEVKGTRSLGEKVFLTDGEVRYAREHKAKMVLFVVHSVILSQDAEGIKASGGSTSITWPWDVDAGTLAPLSYSYLIPAQPASKPG